MNNVTMKYAKLVDALLTKTRVGKIPWSFESSRQAITVWNNDVLLTIKRDQDENFEDLYKVSMINKSGDYLESFDDTGLSNIPLADKDDNYFVRLRNLYELGSRQATGADKALDEFIAAVENDDLDLPF